ncbi:hypothetical protein FEM48_Zijuj11G0058700 [Ziziphus jujuba var. spinosa]|uniref:Uncharacterized protein n=1 Tax=Ziziphus jujuba var. spinosa TaxID=714518 RepID=A0A978UH74_ZIZJJ|nr:hypothetical protein FEM48_Zijuj11G0058700 [Ziziphus jujuba var. spinosa]
MFPNIVEKIELITSLDLSSTAIKQLPSSIDHLVALSKLRLSACKKLVNIPSTIYKLVFLDVHDLSGCKNFSTFPNYDQEIHGNFELRRDSLGTRKLKLQFQDLIFHTSLAISLQRKPTLLSECLPYSPFKDTKISVIERVQHIKKIKVQSTTMSTACGIHILWDGDEIMIEGKPIKVSDSISHIIDRTFDDFANGGMQFSWSSRQRQKREVSASFLSDSEVEVNLSGSDIPYWFSHKREKHNYDRGVPISSCGFMYYGIKMRTWEPVSARTNIVGSEDWEEEELANISETEDMEEKYITSLSLVSESFRTLAFQ